MKITIVLGAFFPVPTTRGGAVEKSWLALAEEFAARNHDVTVISRWTRTLPQRETTNGVRHLRVAGFDQPRSMIKLKALDLIYSWRARLALPDGEILVTNTFWLPLLLPSRTAAGRVYVSVGRYPKGQMRWYGRVERLQAPSHDIAQAIAREAPTLREKIRTIPYPAPRRAANPPPWTERERILLYTGRVHPEKGVHLLVEAFAAFRQQDWQLEIVGPSEVENGGGGPGYQCRLQTLANNARVTFAGPIFDENELRKHFEKARLFVYPSLAHRGETFGLAPLEAMTHGCAVLVSNLACFRDFVIPNETGFVFDHTCSKRTLTEKLGVLMQSDNELAVVADAGRKKAAEFSLPRVAEKHLEDFASLL